MGAPLTTATIRIASVTGGTPADLPGTRDGGRPWWAAGAAAAVTGSNSSITMTEERHKVAWLGMASSRSIAH
jgi:hypothetical protein